MTKSLSDSIAKHVPTEARRGGLRDYLPWLAALGVLAVLPFVFRSGTAHTVLSLMGITIIFALSYNVLLGETGLLSFGHAVYYGLGCYFTVHAMNSVIASGAPVPLVVMPLIGGLAGLAFAAIFGWVSTKRSGTAFAMISLGLAELVGSSSLILRTFFGGEEGVSTNRTKLTGFLGFNFGPQIEMYFLIAFWCFVCAVALYALTRTPLGRMCNAVRDNPERVQFVGYNPQVVRYLAFCISGFFAGIAGALAAINFELANAAVFSAHNSGLVLLATFIGGAGAFIGPILGAVLVNYLQTMLSDITEIWQLYFGLLFIAVVLYAPGGLAGLLLLHRHVVKAGLMGRLVPVYAMALAPSLLALAGAIAMVEMIAHVSIHASEGPMKKIFGIVVDTKSFWPWAGAILMLAAGVLMARAVFPRVSHAWDEVRAEIGRRRTEQGA